MPEIQEDFLEKMMPQIKQIAEENNIEDLDVVIELLKEYYKEISEYPSSKRLPKQRIFNKAFGKVCAELGSTQGERVNVLVLAYDEPRDWNAAEREAILKAWEKSPKARDKLKKEGKVMMMKKGGEMVVVSEIDKYAVSSTNECVVISGKEIEEGEQPIPRDYRTTLGDGKTQNRRFTFPLDERWSLTQRGLVQVDDSFKQFEARIYGNWAKPEDKNFLPAVAPAFGLYKGVYGVSEEKSTEDKTIFNFINAIEPLEEDVSIEEIIFSLEGQGVILAYKPIKGNVKEEDKGKVFLVDMDDIDDFHDEVMARRDKEGNVIKTPSNYDSTHWDRYGIGIYYLISKKELESGDYALRFRDYTNASNSCFSNMITHDIISKIGENLPAECMVSFRTTRTNKRYDPETKVSVEDPIYGDINLGNLLGLRPTLNLEE